MNIRDLFEDIRHPKGKLISVVLPVYNESECLPHVVHELYEFVGTRLSHYNFEMSFIDDRSTDNSFEVLSHLSEQSPPNVRMSVLRLAKNSGSHVAVTAGLNIARGDFCIIMASDGQDPASVIADLIREWETGHDVVIAARYKNLDHTWIEQVLSQAAWKVMAWSTKIDIPEGGCDLLGLDARVLRAFNKMDERNTTFVFRIYSLGYNQKQLHYIKRARIAGKSKWTIVQKLAIMFDAITGYSNRPLRLIAKIGMLLLVVLGLRWAYVVFRIYVLGEVPSELTIILNTIFTSLGVTVLLLGMISDYLWRILDETRKRPLYEFSEAAGRIFE